MKKAVSDAIEYNAANRIQRAWGQIFRCKRREALGTKAFWQSMETYSGSVPERKWCCLEGVGSTCRSSHILVDEKVESNGRKWSSDEPRRPPAAFFMYTQEAIAAHGRQLEREELLDLQRGWKDMAPEQKAAFEERAQQARRIYEKQKHEFQKHGRYEV